MTTINKIARAGVIGTLLMSAVALKASNPITNVNKTPNQTEVVSKEGASALRAASLGVNEVQQGTVQTVRNKRIDNIFRKFAENANDLNEINRIINNVYKNYGTFLASAQIQHELDRQQLYILLKEKTGKLAKINPSLGKEVKEIGPNFYKSVRANGKHVEKWLNEEYTPSVLALLDFDHKPTAEEVIKRLDDIAEGKANFTIDDIIDYHVFSDYFIEKNINNKKDNLSMSDLIAYKMFVIDKIIFKKVLEINDFFGKDSQFRKYANLKGYYDDWMDSVSPEKNK